MIRNTLSRPALNTSCLILIFIIFIITFDALHAQEQPQPFFPDGTYLEEVPTPDEILGFPLGKDQSDTMKPSGT